MKRLTTLALAALLLLTPLAVAQPPQEATTPTEISWTNAGPSGTVLVRNATIWTQDEAGILDSADLLVRDGVIVEVGRGIAAPEGATIVDATGMHVTPGLIDAHSHSGVGGLGGVNEGGNNISPETSIEDILDPDSDDLYRQLAGGTTAAQILHGSANAIGGRSALVKWRYGAPRARDLLIEGATPTIKFALGENPKRQLINLPLPGLPRSYPATRLGVANLIRSTFLAAKDYQAEWAAYEALSDAEREHAVPPRRDVRLEVVAEILDGERLVHSHAYRQDEIIMLIRVAEEMGFQIGAFQHVLEGYKASWEIAAHGAGASTFSDWWAYKIEVIDAIPYNGAIMHDDGVVVSFNSDSDELARRLNQEAAKAVRYGGLAEQDALGFVTSNPARQLRLFDRIGSLRAGKDADFVIWNGHPLSVYSRPQMTFVDGRKLFDRETDREMIAARQVEKERIVALIEGDSTTDEGAENEEDEPEDADRYVAPDPAPRSYVSNPMGQDGVTAIVGATVHTVSGDPIANGVVMFEDGVITAVGGPETAIPEGATRVDAAGQHLYPGMIAADSIVGLSEIDSLPDTVDTSEIDQYNSDLRAEVAVNASSDHIPVTRANGVTHTLTIPRGGTITGASALLRMDGWTWEEMTALSRAAMHLAFPGGGGFSFFGPPPSEDEIANRRKEALAELDAFLDGARAYARAREAASAGGPRHDIDVKLEGMLPVLAGHMPLFVHTNGAREIRAALDWASGRELRLVILDRGDTWRAAEELAAANVPVVIAAVTVVPRLPDDPYDAMYANAARLAEAGVKVVIADSGDDANTEDRNIPFQAGMAAAFGLPKQEALRAVTLYPAQILGLDDALGSIEPGKSASLVLTDGDMLEIRSNVLQEWIDGRAVDLESRHTRLWKKWRDRPRPAGE
jgi:imidazolonepropionase-like amidohydrolase